MKKNYYPHRKAAPPLDIQNNHDQDDEDETQDRTNNHQGISHACVQLTQYTQH